MLVDVFPRMFSIRLLEDGSAVETDPYFGQATVFALNSKIAYLYDQLSQKPLTRAFYKEAFRLLKGLGFEQAIYSAPNKRRSLGGVPIPEMEDFYNISLIPAE
jgi:hypothetical protein